jgi:hypothetical protein
MPAGCPYPNRVFVFAVRVGDHDRTLAERNAGEIRVTTNPEHQLASFFASYTPEIASFAEAVRNKMRRLYPNALELVYDNYNALAIGYSPSVKASEAIFSIALYPKWVSFFFLQARGLSDPARLLKGSGTVCKHVVLTSPEDLNDAALQNLMHQAQEIAKVSFPAKGEHRLIIKSVSAKQRPRRPAAGSSKPTSPTKRTRRANSANTR